MLYGDRMVFKSHKSRPNALPRWAKIVKCESIIFIVVLGMMIDLLLSSWRRFFVSGMMILEYSLVMAEGCQRQNWTVYYILYMLRRVVVNFFLIFNFFVLYFKYDFT